jgi:hypothetical protein
MLDIFNNNWIVCISIILFIIIIKKIINLNKPFDEDKFIEQYINQQKIAHSFNLGSIHETLPILTSYYIGLY